MADQTCSGRHIRWLVINIDWALLWEFKDWYIQKKNQLQTLFAYVSTQLPLLLVVILL